MKNSTNQTFEGDELFVRNSTCLYSPHRLVFDQMFLYPHATAMGKIEQMPQGFALHHRSLSIFAEGDLIHLFFDRKNFFGVLPSKTRTKCHDVFDFLQRKNDQNFVEKNRVVLLCSVVPLRGTPFSRWISTTYTVKFGSEGFKGVMTTVEFMTISFTEVIQGVCKHFHKTAPPGSNESIVRAFVVGIADALFLPERS